MPIKWTLDNVKFSDGGEASGFFITGPGKMTVRINTTAGSDMLAEKYRKYEQVNHGFAEYRVRDGTFYAKFGASGFGDRALWLNTAVHLSMYTHGTFAIVPGPAASGPYDFRCSQETHTYVDFDPVANGPKVSTLFRTVLPGGTIIATLV